MASARTLSHLVLLSLPLRGSCGRAQVRGVCVCSCFASRPGVSGEAFRSVCEGSSPEPRICHSPGSADMCHS